MFLTHHSLQLMEKERKTVQKLSWPYILLGGILILIGYSLATLAIQLIFTPGFTFAVFLQLTGFVILNLGGVMMFLYILSQFIGTPDDKVRPSPVRKVCRVCGAAATLRYAGLVFFCDAHKPEDVRTVDLHPEVAVKVCPRCRSTCTEDAEYCWNCQHEFTNPS